MTTSNARVCVYDNLFRAFYELISLTYLAEFIIKWWTSEDVEIVCLRNTGYIMLGSLSLVGNIFCRGILNDNVDSNVENYQKKNAELKLLDIVNLWTLHCLK